LLGEFGGRSDQLFVRAGGKSFGVFSDEGAFDPIGAAELDVQVEQAFLGVCDKPLGFFRCTFGAGNGRRVWLIRARSCKR
jgi:hypothetical protein